NGLSEEAAMARINSQMSNKERTDVADVKIENASTEGELRSRVEKAWKSLQTRVGRKSGSSGPASPATVAKTGSVKRAASGKTAASGDSKSASAASKGDAKAPARTARKAASAAST